MAGSVNSQPRREADFPREGLAGEGQLSAAIGKSRSRPCAVTDDRQLDGKLKIIGNPAGVVDLMHLHAPVAAGYCATASVGA